MRSSNPGQGEPMTDNHIARMLRITAEHLGLKEEE